MNKPINKIMFVCHGNICRSTMAEFLMKDLANKHGKSDEYIIASSGTSSEEQGNPVHYGTRKILNSLGISCSGKYAEKLYSSDYDNYDLFIGMDERNVINMKRIFNGDPENKVRLLLEYAGEKRNVADPYWTGDFDATYKDVKKGVDALFKFLSN